MMNTTLDQDQADITGETALGRSEVWLRRVAGSLLLGAFLMFELGVVVVPFEIWAAKESGAEHLRLVAANQTGFLWANYLMLTANILAWVGLRLLTNLLRGRTGGRLGEIGLAAFGLAIVLWLVFVTSRTTLTPWAGQELARTGAIPSVYEPLEQWRYGLFFISNLFANFSVLLYGGAVVLSNLLPKWLGWGTVSWISLTLGFQLVSGSLIPDSVYAGLALVGVVMILSRRASQRFWQISDNDPK